ncbi:MAG: hypothetical protein IK152_07255 [Lachnospiraceae bacterium]|nr:hypothetical protein [Lachnospiraceae bacterium]
MKYYSALPARFQWTMKIDFQEDLKDYCYRILKSGGFEGVARDESVFQYYNLIKRQIVAKPRRVLRSKEFICPPEYEKALHSIENCIRNGADLTPFMSLKINNVAYNDLLLNDWGIYHFHLSIRPRDDGFVGRSEYQIFAYVSGEVVYLLQVYRHDKIDLYSQQEIIRILEENWPEVIENNRIPGAVKLTQKINDHEYALLREAHVSTFVELGKNRVYGLIGGGYASNGFSMEAIRQANYWNNRMAVLQRCFIYNAEVLGKRIANIIDSDENACICMDIELLWIDNADQITTIEKNYKMVIQLDALNSCFRICRLENVFGESFRGINQMFPPNS